MNKDELIAKLDLQPLEGEGGLFSTIYLDELSNAIYFMVVSPDFSVWSPDAINTLTFDSVPRSADNTRTL